MKTLFIGFLYAVTLIAMLLPSMGKAAGKQNSRADAKASRTQDVRTSRSSNARVPRDGQTKLSTTMQFSGSLGGGQYQIPSEATAKIENEKPIEELLGLRTQFRDRMKQDEERK